MLDLLSRVSKKWRTPNGWYKFDALCCEAQGKTKKRQQRGGLLPVENDGWVYNCVNCGFKAQYRPGQPLSRNVRKLMEWQGYSEEEIGRANLESLAQRSIYDVLAAESLPEQLPGFEDRRLPEGAVEIDTNDALHLPYAQYCRSRNITSRGIYITPNAPGRDSFRIIIPFRYQSRIVGHSSRYFDERTPKYISDHQPGYVFNTDAVAARHNDVVVVEGLLDALSIGAVAVMHNDINRDQIAILKSLNKRIIIVPDQDLAGMKLVERAAEQGFMVSLPEWAKEIKDVNDAVKAYGPLATYVSIIRSATRSKIKIELRRKEIEKRSR